MVYFSIELRVHADKVSPINDSPSDNDLLVRTASSNTTHQLGHALVVVHIHRDLALSLRMRKGETRPDFQLGYTSCRGRGRGIGMSHTEQGTDDSGGRLFRGGSSSVVVEDLGENRGVDGDSSGSSAGMVVESGRVRMDSERIDRATYGADPDVEGRSRYSADMFVGTCGGCDGRSAQGDIASTSTS